MKGLALGFILLAGAVTTGVNVAHAQETQPSGNEIDNIAADPENASSALARYIRILATSPQDVEALLGAGNAALHVGDVQAALAFFARADEAAPRDGRVKAGMGSALVQAEQPQDALKFFGEAVSLEIPPWRIASDRGLAYDMIGDQARAQADYALVLRRGSDAETERRMALSKAISGDSAGALATLGPQLQRQDRVGWRTHAFVLALIGDTKGAVQAAEAVMPGAKVSEMEPFLARLPRLAAADRAMAVHFGRFPGEAEAAPAYYSAATTPAATKAQAPGRANGLADVVAIIEDLSPDGEDGPDIEITQATQAVLVKEKTQPKPVATKPAPKKAKPTPPKEPSRIWVQLASGQNRNAFAREFKEIKGKTAKLLAGKTAWIAKEGATNRLLIGPFKTDKEASALVNALSKEKVSSFRWTSDTGQPVEKMSAK